MKNIITSIGIIILFVFFSCNGHDRDALTKIGDKVPVFSIQLLNDKTFSTKQAENKVLFINFFATWCGPCMKEMPFLEKDIWKTHKENTNFKMISIGRKHTTEELNKFVDKKDFTFPVAADPNREVYNLFAKKYIPRNYIIDKNGIIVYQSKGFDGVEDIKKMMKIIQEAIDSK